MALASVKSMSRRHSLGGCVVVVVSWAAVSLSQVEHVQSKAEPSSSAVQLLQRAQEAMGGVSALAAVRDSSHTMMVRLTPDAGGYAFTQVSYYIAPNHFRQEQETSFGRTVVYSDGENGWMVTPQGVGDLTADTLASVRGVLFRQPSTLMLSDRDPQRSVRSGGTDTAEVSSADGQSVRIQFDTETGLPLRQSYSVVAANGRRALRLETLSDWRVVNGVRLPFRAVQFEDGEKTLELIVSEYKLNSGLETAELRRIRVARRAGSHEPQMKLNPQVSLAFNGQCEAAFRRYAECLDGVVAFMLRWGDSPLAGDVPPEWAGKINHATLKVGDAVIMGGDVPPDRYERPKGFSCVLQMDDAVAAERVFESLAANGRIDMPLQETFWASRFGAVVDQFGIPWSINCEKAAAPAT